MTDAAHPLPTDTAEPLRAILEWRMCSDPWPGGDMSIVDAWLNSWCAMAGFSDWVDAYHTTTGDNT
jgi:hypothetical protein